MLPLSPGPRQYEITTPVIILDKILRIAMSKTFSTLVREASDLDQQIHAVPFFRVATLSTEIPVKEPLRRPTTCKRTFHSASGRHPMSIGIYRPALSRSPTPPLHAPTHHKFSVE